MTAPTPPTQPPGARGPASASTSRSGWDALPTAGRVAIVLAATGMAVVLVLSFAMASFATVRTAQAIMSGGRVGMPGHLGGEGRGEGWFEYGPGRADGSGEDGWEDHYGPDHHEMDDGRGLGGGPYGPGGPGMPGPGGGPEGPHHQGPLGSVGALGLLGQSLLHGELTVDEAGTPVALVVQTGQVSAIDPGGSLTLVSSDGFSATYLVAPSSRIAPGLAVGTTLRLVAAQSDMVVRVAVPLP